MYPTVKFYSNKDGEIFNFLLKYNKLDNNLHNEKKDIDSFMHLLEWEKHYENPIEIATIIGVFADNIDKFSIAMWVSLDKGVLIKITPNNADGIIRYLYERFPY